ncbi:hypothetical protein HanRHA438_Chr11g0517921 [Helianthus annuus]|nr:hypothetical protein HanRHA438_Chr11g0517921 [Helianthus annuus]
MNPFTCVYNHLRLYTRTEPSQVIHSYTIVYTRSRQQVCSFLVVLGTVANSEFFPGVQNIFKDFRPLAI